MLCKRCERDLPVDQFDPSRQKLERLKAFCRECCCELSVEAKAARRRQGDLERKCGKGTNYRSRNAFLREIGFQSYAAYLASDLWKAIRERVFKLKGRKCFLCGGFASQLHHNRYRINDLTGKTLKYIKPICGDCHREIEFIQGQKATVSQAKSAFKRRRKAAIRGN